MVVILQSRKLATLYPALLVEEIVQGKGYVLLPELFDPQKIAEARL